MGVGFCRGADATFGLRIIQEGCYNDIYLDVGVLGRALGVSDNSVRRYTEAVIRARSILASQQTLFLVETVLNQCAS
ncbi:hypothetical protein ACHQM5_014533 [Ranunculus cassubicifolius]